MEIAILGQVFTLQKGVKKHGPASHQYACFLCFQDNMGRKHSILPGGRNVGAVPSQKLMRGIKKPLACYPGNT